MGVRGEICDPNAPDFRSMKASQLIRYFDDELREDPDAVVATCRQSCARKEIINRGPNIVDEIVNHLYFDDNDPVEQLSEAWSRLIKEICGIPP